MIRKHECLRKCRDISIFIVDDWKPDKPSFFIEWNRNIKQWVIK